MYLDYYGIDKEPFHITPDPEFLFLSPSHKEALGAMIYGVRQRKGFLAVTGEVGLGKTTVLRAFIEKLDKEQMKTVFVFNANVSYKGLLKIIYRDLGLELATDDVFEMVNGLHEALIEEYKADRNVVLIIDEAQNMPVETLENLRMLSNLETSKDKLLQILLIGQPELENMLDRRELRQLKQRLAVRAKLQPLTESDSLDYIQQRLRVSGGEPDEIFTKGALQAIVHDAKGVPRRINIICDNALVTGYGYNQKPITKKIVQEVIADLDGRGQALRPGFKRAAVLVLMGVVFATLLWMGSGALGNFLKMADKNSEGDARVSTSVTDRTSLQQPLQGVRESGGLIRKFPVTVEGNDPQASASEEKEPGDASVAQGSSEGGEAVPPSELSSPMTRRGEPSVSGGPEREESMPVEDSLSGDEREEPGSSISFLEEEPARTSTGESYSTPTSEEVQRQLRDPGDAIELLLQRRMEDQP